MQKEAALKLDALFERVEGQRQQEEERKREEQRRQEEAQRLEAQRLEEERTQAAEERRREELARRARESLEARERAGDWLQFGYKPLEPVFDGDWDNEDNPPEYLDNEEWSHLDSNQGPPACEAGALTS